MAKSPNTDPFNGYSASWTQPYLPTSYNPFYNMNSGEIYNKLTQIDEEMIRIDAVDKIVQNMLTYPDAERILKTINDNL